MCQSIYSVIECPNSFIIANNNNNNNIQPLCHTRCSILFSTFLPYQILCATHNSFKNSFSYVHIQSCGVVDQARDDDLVDGGREPGEDEHQGGWCEYQAEKLSC